MSRTKFSRVLLVVVLEEPLEPEPIEFRRAGMKRFTGQRFIHTPSHVPGGQAILNQLLLADAVHHRTCFRLSKNLELALLPTVLAIYQEGRLCRFALTADTGKEAVSRR